MAALPSHKSDDQNDNDGDSGYLLHASHCSQPCLCMPSWEWDIIILPAPRFGGGETEARGGVSRLCSILVSKRRSGMQT